MRKTAFGALLAVLLLMLASCGGADVNGIPDYPGSSKADIDYFTSHILPAPPWANIDGSSYSGGPFKDFKIDKSEYVIIKDPSNPGLKNFYNVKLDGWKLTVDDKGQDSLLGMEYEMYAWENGNKAFLVYMLTDADNIVLTQVLSKD